MTRSLAPIVGAAGLVVFGVVACVPQPAGRTATDVPGGVPGASTTTASQQRAVTPVPSGPSPTISFGRPTATPLPTFFVYQVQPGDTLTSIAREFETTTQSIGYWNRATWPSLDPESPAYDPNTIRVGWTLMLIPGAEVDEQELTPPPSP